MPVYEMSGAPISQLQGPVHGGVYSVMMDAGIDSFKIEADENSFLMWPLSPGLHRRAIDDYLKDPSVYRKNLAWYREEIGKHQTAGFTTGFYWQAHFDDHIYDSSTYVKSYTYLGTVKKRSWGWCRIEQKINFLRGDH